MNLSSFARLIFLLLFLLACTVADALQSIVAHAQQLTPAPAQPFTLSQLTANNTAACPATGPLPSHCEQRFRGQEDTRSDVATPVFDPPTGNVSDEDIHGYLTDGQQTRIFANFMLGFCTGGESERCHNNVRTGYTSDDDKTISAQIEDLRKRHIDGAIMSWDGAGTKEDEATVRFQKSVNRLGCSGPQQCDPMYLIMYDGASMAYTVGSTGVHGTAGDSCAHMRGKDYENCVVRHIRNDMCYMNGMHWGNDAYLKSNGRPVVQIFPSEGGIPASGSAPSWEDVWKHIDDWNKKLPRHCGKAPYNADNGVPLLVFEHATGFAQPGSSGAYPWVGVAGTDPGRDQFHFRIVAPGDPESLDHFFQTARQNSDKQVWGIAYKGFNSSSAAWGTNRLLDQECGRVWVATLTAGNHYFTDKPLPYLQIVTWNDYNEGTEIETGIDNCFTIAAAVDGSTLTWRLQAANRLATIATISGIEIYDSADGRNLTRVQTQPPALSGTWDLGSLGPGPHQIFVRMVGKNSILNRMSPPVAFTGSKAAAPGQ
jgi:hypothetical protein